MPKLTSLPAQPLLYSLIVLCAMTAMPAIADKTDPDLIPPDVTLTTGNAAAPAAAGGEVSSVPGMATGAAPAATGAPAAANAAVPGMANPAQQGAPSNMPPGLPLNMGAKPGAPPSAGGMYQKANPWANPMMQQGGAATSSGLYQGSGTPVDPNKKDPIATIETSKGEIRIMLFRKYAPKTVDNFMDLVQKGFYNGLKFHRVEPGFCIQGGCPKGDGTGLYIDPKTHAMRFLPLEVSPNLRHNGPGVVAMARFGASPNSGSCQFYITLGAKANLDNQYTIFGGVLSGMEVVNSIQKGDTITSVSLQEPQ